VLQQASELGVKTKSFMTLSFISEKVSITKLSGYYMQRGGILLLLFGLGVLLIQAPFFLNSFLLACLFCL
jgi:hypothetical protein